MKKAQVVLSTVLVLVMLAGTTSPAIPVRGQSPPPEVLGPGWHMGTADPVSPAEARRILSGRPRPASRTPDGIPASETEATVEIQALARALEHEPKLIFDYVHNHVEYVPIFGSVNGATTTLLAGRGNDWDQTSLFIALMRAAGYTVDYAVGNVTYSTDRLANWLGVGNAAVGTMFAYGGVPVANLGGAYRITRVWAQATIGSQTYVFDPAMKEYAEIGGIDLEAASGYDRATFMTRAQEEAIVASDFVQYMNDGNIRADLITYSMNLVDYIQTNLPDATLAEVIGGREILATEMTAYPTDLPYALDVTNESTYPTIPDAYRHSLRVEHEGEGIDHTFYTFQIAGQRVSIFYDESDNYRPVLRVDGTAVATGNATSPGNWYDLTLTVDHPYAANGGTYADQSGAMQLVSGSDYVIVHDFGAASPDLMASRSRLLDQYVHDGLADTSESVRGEGLWLMGLTYCHEDHLFTRLLGQVGEGIFIQHHLLGRISQEEGYSIDLPLSTTSFAPSGGASALTAHRAYAMMASALEHGMLEQMQGSDREAVSSIKLLHLNNAAGDMTFLADADNWNSVQENLIDYHWAALNLIKDDINNGNTVVLPQNGAINLNQWYGVGVISYKGSGMGMWIGGGWFGGAGSGLWDILIKGILDMLKEWGLLEDEKEETETLESDDPVDMVTGAFHFGKRDLIAGPDGLLSLNFSRSYNSNGNYALGPLGYGWTHNHNLSLAPHSDYGPGLGQRQPTDAAALIVYAQVILDLMANEENIQGWMTADLATKWAMDQLLDNAVTVHLSTTSLEYIRLADGSNNPPPGVRYVLVQEGDYTYVQQGAACMIYDAEGRGRFWIDGNGNTLTYTYDGESKLQSVGAPTLGQTLTLVYSGTLLTSVSDQAGRAVTFEYTDDELTTFHDAEGYASHYGYDDAHRLTTVTTPRGHTVTANIYDTLGRVITQTDALSNTTTFYFGGHRNMEVHPDGGRVVYYVDNRGLTTAREDFLGNCMTMDYDGQYHLRTATDREGSVITFDYHPASGEYAAVTNSEGHTTHYTYTSQQHTCTNPLNSDTVTFTSYYVEQVDYPDGSSESYTYYDDGNMETRTDQAGKTWTYEYNDRGQVRKLINPLNGVTEYTYNPDGTLASSTDSDLGVTTHGYDPYLRQNQVTHPDGNATYTAYNLNDRVTVLTDERNNTTTYQYDPNGNLQYVYNAYGEQTAYAFNAMDLVWQTTDRRGNTSTETYDEMNRVETITDPNGNTTTNEHDPRDWLNQTTDPAGKVWQTGHTEEGVVVSRTTPQGFVTAYGLDSLGNTTVITDPLGYATTFLYDEMSRVTAVTDPLSRTTTYDYDDRGLLTGVTLPDNRSATYEYNDLGLIEVIHDLNGQTWRFDYTSMGRLLSQTDPLTHTWEYTYTARGLLEQITCPTGETETRTYDATGNLTRKQYSGGLDLNFSYDELNRMTEADGISLGYNEESQVITTMDQASGIASFADYDDGGRLETVTYADVFTVTYQYNSRNLLTHVTDNLTGVTVQFVYDDDGRLTDVLRSNGVNATPSWDDASRLTHIQDGTLIDLGYGYDAAGQVISQTYSLPLDPADNLVGQFDNLSYDSASQISSSSYTYDSRGRLTADASHVYTWDSASRLTGIDSITLSYNGMGRLLTRTENGQTTRYYYNHALALTPVVAERDEATGQFTRYYVWTPDGGLLYMIDAADGLALSTSAALSVNSAEGNKVYFYHFDHTGSTLALTGESGALTDAYAYTPYGRLIQHTGSSSQPFTFSGRWGVMAAGDLYYMRTRYYDPGTAHFLARDSAWGTDLESVPELNPYIYALCNPLSFVDPMGTDACRAGRELVRKVFGKLKPNRAQGLQSILTKEKLLDILRSFIPGISAFDEGNLAAIPGQVAWDIFALSRIALVELPAEIFIGLVEYGEPDTHGVWSYSEIYKDYYEMYGEMPWGSAAAHAGTLGSYPRDIMTSGLQLSFQAVHAVGSGLVSASAYVLSGGYDVLRGFFGLFAGPSAPAYGEIGAGIPVYSTKPPGTYNASFGAQYDVRPTGQVLCH